MGPMGRGTAELESTIELGEADGDDEGHRASVFRSTAIGTGSTIGTGPGFATALPATSFGTDPVAALTAEFEVVDVSAFVNSPGRADTARAFKERSTAPSRSSVPTACVRAM